MSTPSDPRPAEPPPNTQPARPARSGRGHRVRRVLIGVGLLAAIGLGLAIASGYWTTDRRLAEGTAEEATEESFYQVPDPVPAAAPGTLLREEPLLSAPNGSKAWRILYHSTDVHGSDILVSGVVVAPDSPAPPGGRPIVSWGHPTTGAAQRCAPSLGIAPFDVIEGLTQLLDAGYVVVATDYSGMGAAGPDSYLIGDTEGNNVLDAARAARALDGTGAGTRLVLWGHSQGGQAVLFAAQRAADYAPELHLQAVAVAAPATNLAELLKADVGDVSGVTIGSYAFAAYSSVYEPTTPGATLESILTPEGAAVTDEMAALCLFGQNRELHDIATPLIGKYLAGDPGTTEPWATLLAQNTPGGVRLPVPLFVAQGDADQLVRPEITAQFVAGERALGTEVTFETIADTGHGLVALRAVPKLVDWLKTAAPASSTAPSTAPAG
ncbi:Secretory lipase [Herbiconiux ginsengi]|uniref:Secretory lipase n=1 Tax=Herbiconiux ginsengi TaxID=381665 RepID=A0A1H3LB73_9MICO|nr:Secretory lipase [Herbiconiux ginsengi]